MLVEIIHLQEVLGQQAENLQKMDAPQGSLISYATAPGSVASDGNSGRNGTYTKYLIKYMQEPGIMIEQVLKRVRISVLNDTNKKQTPWEASCLIGDFMFVASNDQKNIKLGKKSTLTSEILKNRATFIGTNATIDHIDIDVPQCRQEWKSEQCFKVIPSRGLNLRETPSAQRNNIKYILPNENKIWPLHNPSNDKMWIKNNYIYVITTIAYPDISDCGWVHTSSQYLKRCN